MINDTNNKIRYTSHKFFLENGYEATNIRDICKAVEIKPSSLYFYYKSKQDLFISIYDEIWDNKIKCMKDIQKLHNNLTAELKLKQLFFNTLEYHSNNFLDEKFLLRYHLFPAEEISASITERYRYWTKEEDKIIESLINECIEKNCLDNKRNTNEYLRDYKKFISDQIISMLIYNVKISINDSNMAWNMFRNSYI